MLERVRKIFSQYVDRVAFFAIIGRFFPKFSPEYKLIGDAYDTVLKEFESAKPRETGEPYFEHLRCVALILLIHLRVRDANVIAAALLHDIMEDIPGWDQDRLALKFNAEISRLVFWVSKPHYSLYGGDKEARNRDYHHKLSTAPRLAVLIKLADRLHNVMTLWASEHDKQKRKIRETQDFYLPLAEAHTVLIHELEDAVYEVMKSWPKELQE
jgi:(p)ppGpp synthase/HD superfamily hydrolase